MSEEHNTTLTFGELTTIEIIRKNKILELYSTYWSDDIPLKPPFNFDEVLPILEDAAEIVSRIRNYVDTTVNKDAMFTLRTSDGSANRYLFYSETNPVEECEKFLRELITATLSSTADFSNLQLETGVSMELIDAFISAMVEYKNELNKHALPRQEFESYSKEQLLALLQQSFQIANQIFNCEDNNDRDQNEEKVFLKAMVKSIENYYLYLVRYQKNSKFVHSIESPTRSELPELINDFVIIEREIQEHYPSESYKTPGYDPSKTQTETDKRMEQTEGDIGETKSGMEEAELEIPVDMVAMEGRMESNEGGMEEEQQVVVDSKEKAKGYIKIAKIESDIEDMEKEFDQLRELVDAFKMDNTKPRESLHEVEKLLRKCLYWGESLMKDLLTLDTFTSDHPQSETRNIRKTQAVQIQKLMDDLEDLKKPLKTHQTLLLKVVHQLDEEEKKINEEKLKIEKEKMKETEKMNVTEPKKQSGGLRPQRRSKPHPSAFPFLPTELQQFFAGFPFGEEEIDEGAESDALPPFVDQLLHSKLEPTITRKRTTKKPSKLRTDLLELTPESDFDEEMEEEEDEGMYGDAEDSDLYYSLLRQWKLMKFEPHFEIERQRGRYLLCAHIPGMRTDDFHIRINERDSILIIAGARLPSRSEFERIKEQTIHHYKVTSPRELTKYLLRYGMHRYGTFSTSLSLPRNVIYEKIEGKYEDNSLIVIAPFSLKKQPTTPVPSRGYREIDSPFQHHRGSHQYDFNPLFFT